LKTEFVEDSRYFNVSCEHNNCTPVSWHEILEKRKEVLK